MSTSTGALLDAALQGQLPNDRDALTLATESDTRKLAAVAAQLRDRGFGNLVTYSRKVFIPLTHLCRDVCHYCTFAQTPKRIGAPYMSIEQVVEIARQGKALGCKEALFTLGEKPELRYKAAREALAQMGYATTLEYLHAAAKAVLEETGLLPHANPGTMTDDEIALLREVSPSMGIMLETASPRLSEKGMPHYGSPDKVPEVRLDTLRRAGAARVPFTSGILIGIGETRLERIESLLALRAVHAEHGHIQEIIVQNFRAKEGTKMRHAPEPDLDELLWTHRRRANCVRARHEHPGAAEPEPGRAAADRRRGHQRLGRRLAADARTSSIRKRRGRTSRNSAGKPRAPASCCTNA